MIYLDCQATTPVDSRILDKLAHSMTVSFGNANSIDHGFGDQAESSVTEATQHLINLIDAKPNDIIYTSGATESINLAIQGTVKYLQKTLAKPCLAVSSVEHKAVLDTCHTLESLGCIEVVHLEVNSHGHLDLAQIERFCAEGINLLCVMAANNEVGTIYPVKEIAAIAQAHNVPFMCDATQAVGKIPIKFQDWGITMLALSAHKFYGPKGVGALAVRKDHNLEPLFYGGGHQRGLRSGTLNVSGIVGLGEACRLRQLEMETDEAAIAIRRNKLQTILCEVIPEIVVNGDIENRLAGNLHISVPGIPNSAVIARVRHKLAISTGAACSSGVETPSHVLTAMGLPEDIVEGALRISLGKFTTDEDITNAAEILSDEIHSVQRLMT